MPRKLKQVLQISVEAIWEQTWSEVAVNAEIPNDRFAWSPPKDWKEWKEPAIE